MVPLVGAAARGGSPRIAAHALLCPSRRFSCPTPLRLPRSRAHSLTPCNAPPMPAGPWIARHALHAAALSIRHPRTGAPLTVRAPAPPDFLAAMEQLGLQMPPL